MLLRDHFTFAWGVRDNFGGNFRDLIESPPRLSRLDTPVLRLGPCNRETVVSGDSRATLA